MDVSMAGSPVAEFKLNIHIYDDIFWKCATFGGHNTHWISGILEQCNSEVLRNILGSRWFVLPSVLGEQLAGGGVMLDLLTGPQAQPHDEGALHLPDVHDGGGGEASILQEVSPHHVHLPGEDVNLHLGDSNSPDIVAHVVVLDELHPVSG